MSLRDLVMNIEDIKKAFYERLGSMSREERIAHVLGSEPTGLIEALSVEKVQELAFQSENSYLTRTVIHRAAYNPFESLVDIVPSIDSCKRMLIEVASQGLEVPEESKLVPIKARNYSSVALNSGLSQVVDLANSINNLGNCELPKKYSYDNDAQISEFELNEKLFFINGKMVNSEDAGVAF